MYPELTKQEGITDEIRIDIRTKADVMRVMLGLSADEEELTVASWIYSASQGLQKTGGAFVKSPVDERRHREVLAKIVADLTKKGHRSLYCVDKSHSQYGDYATFQFRIFPMKALHEHYTQRNVEFIQLSPAGIIARKRNNDEMYLFKYDWVKPVALVSDQKTNHKAYYPAIFTYQSKNDTVDHPTIYVTTLYVVKGSSYQRNFCYADRSLIKTSDDGVWDLCYTIGTWLDSFAGIFTGHGHGLEKIPQRLKIASTIRSLIALLDEEPDLIEQDTRTSSNFLLLVHRILMAMSYHYTRDFTDVMNLNAEIEYALVDLIKALASVKKDSVIFRYVAAELVYYALSVVMSQTEHKGHPYVNNSDAINNMDPDECSIEALLQTIQNQLKAELQPLDYITSITSFEPSVYSKDFDHVNLGTNYSVCCALLSDNKVMSRALSFLRDPDARAFMDLTYDLSNSFVNHSFTKSCKLLPIVETIDSYNKGVKPHKTKDYLSPSQPGLGLTLTKPCVMVYNYVMGRIPETGTIPYRDASTMLLLKKVMHSNYHAKSFKDLIYLLTIHNRTGLRRLLQVLQNSDIRNDITYCHTELMRFRDLASGHWPTEETITSAREDYLSTQNLVAQQKHSTSDDVHLTIRRMLAEFIIELVMAHREPAMPREQARYGAQIFKNIIKGGKCVL